MPMHRGPGDRAPARGRSSLLAAIPLAGLLIPTSAPGWVFFYREWLGSEGIPVHDGFAIADVGALPLAPWKRLGALGAYIDLHGYEGLVGAYVLEIAPGAKTLPERHIFEEYLYVLSGAGETTLWQPGGQRQTLAWREGSLISPPLNAWHEHLNRGDAPAKLVGFTNAPPILDFYRNPDFVFDNPHVFQERWDGAADHFTRVRAPTEASHLEMNFVEDVAHLGKFMRPWKKKRTNVITLDMNGNSLNPHVSEWEPESFQAAHRHGPGASVLILGGSGFALMWPREAGTQPYRDGHGDRVVRIDFQRGTLYSPPTNWYHTHFNTSAETALSLAFTAQGRDYRVQFAPMPSQVHGAVRKHVEGLPYDQATPHLIGAGDEDPALALIFEEAVKRARAESNPPSGR